MVLLLLLFLVFPLSLGPSEVNFTLLTVQNDVSWGLLAISKDIYNYPAVKRPQKGCTVFAEDQELKVARKKEKKEDTYRVR